MHKYGDTVKYLRNGVVLNALVLQAVMEVDTTHKQGLTLEQLATPKECLLLAYLEPAAESKTIHSVSTTVATAFSVKPLGDGVASGWYDPYGPDGSGSEKYQGKSDYSQANDPYGIAKEYTAQSAAVDVRGNTGTGPRPVPTQAEADAIVAQAAAERVLDAHEPSEEQKAEWAAQGQRDHDAKLAAEAAAKHV